jgi:GT2 family glycosyltransferase
LEKYLPIVEKYSQMPQTQIVVADNGSTDDSLAYLYANHKQIEIIKLDKNYGFAEGYNRALKHVKSDYYVLLNSDVEVTEGWLLPLLDIMQRDNNIAACMPTIRCATARDKFEYAGAAGGFIDKFGYTFCRGRVFDTIETDTGQYATETEIFWATGACLMIRAELFHRAGGFDGNFFAHMEEIDLCWRLKNEGYTIWHTPQSLVYHLGGGTLPQSSPYKTYLNYRNNLLMLYKNLPQSIRNKILIIRQLLDGISVMYSIVKGDFSTIKPVYNAHKDYRKLRKNYKKLTDVNDYPSKVYEGSIVFKYFIMRCKTFKNNYNRK